MVGFSGVVIMKNLKSKSRSRKGSYISILIKMLVVVSVMAALIYFHTALPVSNAYFIHSIQGSEIVEFNQ